MIQAENPCGAQAGSGRKRWLIEGAKEIALAAGSGQWRLTADGKRLQYAPAVKEEEAAIAGLQKQEVRKKREEKGKGRERER